jgi:predicted AlkP superfamily pyrophosphatase or phosphodiesterase
MHTFSPQVRRVTVVVLDGLRPDAIDRFSLYTVARLAERGAATMRGTAVAPSVTAAAMATLFTGAAPERHGLQTDHFRLPRARGPLHPWPKLLADRQLPTTFMMARIPVWFSPVARGFASILGIEDARFAGDSCTEIAAAAAALLAGRDEGVLLLHWPDADRAGHTHGWMSPEYGMAAGRMDNALGRLVRHIDLDDPAELLIVCADHGGGGGALRSHDSSHHADTTIPVILAGGAVRAGDLGHDVQFGDIPATLVWALGLPQPESYAGRPLVHAFRRAEVAA